MLITVTFLDLRLRSVNWRIWWAFIGTALLFQGIDITTGYSLFLPVFIASSISVFAAAVFYYFRIWGGSDSYALALIGLMVPIFYPTVHLYTVTALITLTNAFLIMLLVPVALLFYNLASIFTGHSLFQGITEPTYRKCFALFFGFRQTTLHSFYVPMESSAGKRTFDFHVWEADHYADKADTWVSPSIPFITFITLAFFVTIFYGDLLTPIYSTVIHMVG
jgi:archaeal preflagellin peptidase FlaK